MPFQNLDLDSGSSNKLSFNGNTNINRKFLFVVVIALLIGFAVGILIGVFAINNDDSNEDAATAPSGVFLPGVAESIIRDADETVTDWILEQLNPDNIRENLRELVAEPHVAGTAKDFEQAEMLRQFWMDVGLDKAVTTPYDILLSYPDDVVPNKIKIFANDAHNDVIVESPDNEANLTPDEWGDFPFPYLGYSGNGTVKGNIVYVNYARQQDFETLEQLGINVSGTIVLARYGRGGRAGKVRRAEQFGAVGVVLYSDPVDYNAPWSTDYYNESVWIPPTATSRGSIFMATGDPLTPGYPAIASAYRYDETDPEAALPKIPALPIGYEVAEQILSILSGQDAPEGWSGRLLNSTNYKIGPGFVNVSYEAELSVHTTNQRRVSYNAFGMIKGETEPDRYVLLGNHRDSWVLGAVDPSSGTATMMELSRVLGQLVKEGRWRPRRTIVFCSWGAEEFGLIGSTEWVEENSKVLDARAVAYINMDIAVTGNHSIRGLGSPPLFSAMYAAAKKVPYHDVTSRDYATVFDEWVDKKPLMEPGTNTSRNVPIINSPGGGSDYGTFQMRAGISCADFRYRQDYTGQHILFYPLYHTSYETFYAVDTLIDPGFVLHATIGKMSGELLRDLADSKLLPFNMSDYAIFLDQYKHALVSYNTTLLEHYGLNITELDRVINLYRAEARTFQEIKQNINEHNPFEVRRINDQMMQIDRAFLDPASLPDRSQIYRHLIHSTPETSGIPGSSFPGLEDALFKVEQAPTDPDVIRELQHHFSVLVFTIQAAAYSLKDTTDIFRDQL